MTTSEMFSNFLENLVIQDRELINDRYGRITRAINREFRNTESRTANSIQIGSYGRKTGIQGLSDLDMIYILPEGERSRYKDDQYGVLSRTKKAVETTYDKTDISVDRLVVVVQFEKYKIEVQPCFEEADGSFLYPDTYRKEWLLTKPRLEIEAVADLNESTNGNTRDLCRMIRAWRNKHGQQMGGLLIDTFVHNFMRETADYVNTAYAAHGRMVRDYFGYIAGLPKDQVVYRAPGSNQNVSVKKRFHRKAKKALELCNKAIDAEGESYCSNRWRKVFGRAFPAAETVKEAESMSHTWRNTEEFIEDKFSTDIRYGLQIDCEVSQSGFQVHQLREFLEKMFKLQPNKKLRFHVVKSSVEDIPEPYDVYWKILNRGEVARRKDCIRGQIWRDTGRMERVERTMFMGDHIVECYLVKNGVLVAKDRIHVPIQ